MSIGLAGSLSLCFLFCEASSNRKKFRLIVPLDAEVFEQANADQLGRLIYEIRGERVMLDSDLASIYGVETKALNRAVKRNRHRFPKDFVFQLTQDESELLRRQIGTLKGRRGQHRKYLPWVFTEHG